MNTISAPDLQAVDQQVVSQCMAAIAAAQREFLEEGKKNAASEDDAPQWTLKDSEEYVLTAKLIRPFCYFPVSAVDDQVRASFGTFQVAIDATNPEHHLSVSPSIRRVCIDRLKWMIAKYFDESTSVEIDSHVLGSDTVEIFVSSSVPKSEVSERNVMNNRKVVITRTAIDRVRKAFARLHDWSDVYDIPLTDDEDEVVMIRVDHNNVNLEKPVPIIVNDRHKSLLAEIGSCELTVANDNGKPLDPARAEDFLIRLGKTSVNRASVAIPADNFHFSVSTIGNGFYWITAIVDVPVDNKAQ